MPIDRLPFLRIHPEAKLPGRATPFSAGLDLCIVTDVQIGPKSRASCRTGLCVEIPSGCYGRIAPRSGLAERLGIDVLAGVIDSDYRGEIVCMLINHGDSPAIFKAGDRIAQLIIEHISLTTADWAENLGGSDRSSGGFGSSGA